MCLLVTIHVYISPIRGSARKSAASSLFTSLYIERSMVFALVCTEDDTVKIIRCLFLYRIYGREESPQIATHKLPDIHITRPAVVYGVSTALPGGPRGHLLAGVQRVQPSCKEHYARAQERTTGKLVPKQPDAEQQAHKLADVQHNRHRQGG